MSCDVGYRLELQSARMPELVKVGAEFRVEIELVNRGFSTLHNPRPVCLALMDRDGKVTELPVAAALTSNASSPPKSQGLESQSASPSRSPWRNVTGCAGSLLTVSRNHLDHTQEVDAIADVTTHCVGR